MLPFVCSASPSCSSQFPVSSPSYRASLVHVVVEFVATVWLDAIDIGLFRNVGDTCIVILVLLCRADLFHIVSGLGYGALIMV